MREHGSGIDGPAGFLKSCSGGWKDHLGVSWVCPQLLAQDLTEAPAPMGSGRRGQFLMTKE